MLAAITRVEEVFDALCWASPSIRDLAHTNGTVPWNSNQAPLSLHEGHFLRVARQYPDLRKLHISAAEMSLPSGEGWIKGLACLSALEEIVLLHPGVIELDSYPSPRLTIEIGEDDFCELFAMPSLTRLVLIGRIKTTRCPPAALPAGLEPRLQELELSFLTDNLCSLIPRLVHLRRLELVCAESHDFSFLSSLGALEHLHLDQLCEETSGLEAMSTLRGLKSLSVTVSSCVSCPGLETLLAPSIPAGKLTRLCVAGGPGTSDLGPLFRACEQLTRLKASAKRCASLALGGCTDMSSPPPPRCSICLGQIQRQSAA